MIGPLTLVLASAGNAALQDVDVPFTKFVLENGLQVVVHEDPSDPVVAVYVVYHVGSGREEPGRSGFAHLFEHILFQGSQNVGDEQHFKLINEAGGTLNGTTNTDRTNYFETLPSNQLELALWLEADRMGFLLPAVTQEKLDRQRDVVKNERRQNYENRPYGRVPGAVASALYPPDHPYSWLTIGSHEDLSAASLEDVHAFFRRWYGPNNATLAIGGDVDPERVRELVEKWFGAIPRGPAVEAPKPRAAELRRPRRVVIEDAVTLPQLTITWPGVRAYHPDEPALDLLGRILSANKSAVLDRALMIDATLASEVSARNDSAELAGTFAVTLRPARGVTLDELERRTHELLAKLAADGVDPEHLQRVKNSYEADFVRRLETVSARTNGLAEYNTFVGQPDFFAQDLARHLAVTEADLARALEQYVVGRPAVFVSVVPEGKLELAASGPPPPVVEPIPDPARARRPAAGAAPEFRSPAVWHDRHPSGVAMIGTRYTEIPMTRLELAVPAGRVHETPETLGLASLCAAMMLEGTRSYSSTELTETLEGLGASLDVGADDDEITLSLQCLDKHLERAVAVLGEVLLEPRFAPEDFARVQKQRLIAIETRADRAATVAADAFQRLVRGDPVLGAPSVGTEATVKALTPALLRAFWQAHVRPEGARLCYVGARDAAGVRALLAPFFGAWGGATAQAEPAAKARPAAYGTPAASGRIYLIDKPGAAQSEIRIGHPSVASTDPEYYPLFVLNYVLGGSFNSRINLNLREDKGWAYGARSSLEGGLRPGAFVANGGIQTDHTAEAVREFLREIEAIRAGVSEEELAFARSALEQAATRQYESIRALLGMLDNIGEYGWPDDYVEQRMRLTRELERAQLKELAAKHIHPDRLIVLVVGDRERVLPGLEALGIGPIVGLEPDGSSAE